MWNVKRWVSPPAHGPPPGEGAWEVKVPETQPGTHCPTEHRASLGRVGGSWESRPCLTQHPGLLVQPLPEGEHVGLAQSAAKDCAFNDLGCFNLGTVSNGHHRLPFAEVNEPVANPQESTERTPLRLRFSWTTETTCGRSWSRSSGGSVFLFWGVGYCGGELSL